MKCLVYLFLFFLTSSALAQVEDVNINKQIDSNQNKKDRIYIQTGSNNKFKPIDSVVVIEPNEDIKTKPLKNPKLASIMSAVVPGAGQIYNGKWWKVPIIYGGFYGLYLVAKEYNATYIKLKYDYNVATGYFENVDFRYFPYATEKELQYFMQRYRRKRDLSYIGIFAIYFFNIIDASVDANLSDFDVSTDLTVGITPDIISSFDGVYATGLKISFRF